MALKIGNNAVANAFVGSSQVRRAYKGGTLVYQGFGPASEQEFIRKEATGGPAQLLKVYGKTIVWNQLVQNGDFSDTSAWNAVSVSNNVGTRTPSVGATSCQLYQRINKKQGHKYLILATIKISDISHITLFRHIWYGGKNLVTNLTLPSASDTWKDYAFIVTGNADVSIAEFNFIANYVSGGAVSGDSMSYKTIRCVDLTLMFGAGNEPTSVDEFLALFPDALTAAYDPGSIQSNKTAELRAYDGGTLRGSLALNLSTLTGKLNGEGASVVVYPDGLRGVGTDRDAAYGSTGVVARAVVDLGTLNWRYSGAFFYATGFSNVKILTDTLICPLYINAEVSTATTTDKAIKFYGDPPILHIKDSAYTTAADFKAAMSGVMLDYPLATPLTYTLDTPLLTDLTCEQGDILQRVSDNNCPFVGEMRFGL